MSLLINPARFFSKTEPSEGTRAIVIDPQVLAEAQNHLSDIDAAGELPLWVRRELMTNLGRRLGDDLTAFAFVAMLGFICALLRIVGGHGRSGMGKGWKLRCET